MTGAADDIVVRDMAITPADFFRLLPRALGATPFDVTGNTARIGTPGHGLTIVLRPLPPRRIALLSIDRSEVTFTFEGYDAAERTAFFERFDRSFHRGGG